MTINWLGTIAALTTFFSIWFGHLAVRKVESISPMISIPAAIFVILGIVCEWISLKAPSLHLATIFGILGMTLLFDGFELPRQQKRIIKGHAPANPDNSRHSKILEQYSSATTLDLLKRDPIRLHALVKSNRGAREKE